MNSHRLCPMPQATVTSVRELSTIATVQGQTLLPMITKSTVDASRLSAGMVFMPPAAASTPHRHVDHEMVVMCLRGWAVTLFGDDLTPLAHGPGDVVYVPAGVPHVAVNLSSRHGLVALEARSDPDFNADVEVLPGLADAARAAADAVRAAARAGTLPIPATWDEMDEWTWPASVRSAYLHHLANAAAARP